MDFTAYRYVVVGCGFFGAVIAERIANDLREPVLVLEKRDHIGGNCYSLDHPGTGIHYHRYGTHIFHTSNPYVWEYIQKFTEFNGYYHQVLTTYRDKVYQLPINLETINSFYDRNLKPYEVEAFLADEVSRSGGNFDDNFEDKAISLLGRPLYEAFIKGYTRKQWGRDPRSIPSHILSRLPFRTDYNESYFFDPWQGVPLKGYTDIFNQLLASELITIQLGTDFLDVWGELPESSMIIYTGPIDRLFGFQHGQLEWRSLDFNERIESVPDYQGTSVMNYAEESVPYTRIHEPRHLHPERSYPEDKTLVVEEYSRDDDGSDPFYPVGGHHNQVLLDTYLSELKKHPNLIAGGRLGDYRYYDMDQTIARALEVYRRIRNHHPGVSD